MRDVSVRRVALPLLALLAAGGAWWACSRSDRRPTRAAPSVLVIAIDTLRADRLGCLGNPRGLTPRIDALAERGVLYEHAFAHAPWTLPSFATLFTSLPPEEHGAGGMVGDWRMLDARHETLAERFRDAGWRTHSIVNVDFLGGSFGLTQGFERVDEVHYPDNAQLRDAAATTDAALAWIRGHADERFFLFAHYFDPHARYAPPAMWRERFADPRDAKSEAFDFGEREQIARWRAGVLQLTADDFARAEKLYDGEVAYVDDEVGRLLDGLAAAGLADSTVVVLTADHGEEFLDHGDWEHGHSLYDELLHVPLIVSFPPRVAPRRVSTAVGTIDVAPTLCALASVEPGSAFRGHDLLGGPAGAEPSAAPLLAFGNFWGPPRESLRAGPWKLIASPPAKGATEERFELYEWTRDPRERDERCASERERCGALRTDLELLRDLLAARASRGAKPVLSPEEARRLDQLGYPGGDGDGDGR